MNSIPMILMTVTMMMAISMEMRLGRLMKLRRTATHSVAPTIPQNLPIRRQAPTQAMLGEI